MTTFSRAPVAALALASTLALAACGGDENPTIGGPATTATSVAAGGTTGVEPATTTTTQGTVFAFTVSGGSVSGPSRVRVSVNDRVTLRVTSDTADEVHVHGYEKRADVGPGQPAEITFTANIPGTFEVELESVHRRITTLEVQP